MTRLTAAILGVLWTSVSPSALAQEPDFRFTKIVDINGNPDANYAEIQEAIDAIGTPGATEHWVVLIYPGTYTIDESAELIHLNDADERISLVGIDRESVIIDVTIIGSGIKITTGDESTRDCTISNLTIRTSGGHGIEIVKGSGGNDKVPKNITIENVTIQADDIEQPAVPKYGITAQNLQDSRIANCMMTTSDGYAIDLTRTTGFTAPTNNILTGLTLLPAGAAKHGISVSDVQNFRVLNSTITPDDGDGIDLIKVSGGTSPSSVTIDNVTITTDTTTRHGIDIESASSDIVIRNSYVETLSTAAHAVYLRSASGASAVSGLRIMQSQLFARGGDGASGPGLTSDVIRLDHPTTNGLIQDSYLQLDKTGLAVNLESNAAGTTYLSLEKLTIRGLYAYPLLDLSGSTSARLANSDLLDADSPYNCVTVGVNTQILNTSIVIDRNSISPPIAQYDSAAVYGTGASGLRVVNSRLQGLAWGMRLDNNCTDVLVANSQLIGSNWGVALECGDEISFQQCTIIADSANGKYATSPDYHGVFIDDKDTTPACEPGSIRFNGCTISASSAENGLDALGVYVKAAPGSSDGPVVFKDCNISARVTTTDAGGALAFGVLADEANSAALDGGSIVSSDAYERETQQFDVNNNSGGTAVLTSGVKYSKWKGPIGSTVQPASTTQRTINVAAISNTAILAATALTTSEQTITTNITNPDVYRVLSVKGNEADMNQTVILIGTNFAGERIADSMTLNGTAVVNGVKPFKTVTKIILPAQLDADETVSVGTTSKLGLYNAISATSDVLQ